MNINILYISLVALSYGCGQVHSNARSANAIPVYSTGDAICVGIMAIKNGQKSDCDFLWDEKFKKLILFDGATCHLIGPTGNEVLPKLGVVERKILDQPRYLSKTYISLNEIYEIKENGSYSFMYACNGKWSETFRFILYSLESESRHN